MKLKDCTKAELIQIITHELCIVTKYDIERALNQIKYQRDIAKNDKVREYGEKANEHLRKYTELCQKYKGMKIVDIPKEDLNKMIFHHKEFKRYLDLELKCEV